MNFEELRKKVGLGLAVVIAQKYLPVGFWEEITLDECFLIYRKISFGSEIAETVEVKMIEKEGTFNEWFQLYKYASWGSELRKAVLAKMIEKKGTLNEWSEVYDHSYNGSELKKAALEQLQKIYES